MIFEHDSHVITDMVFSGHKLIPDTDCRMSEEIKTGMSEKCDEIIIQVRVSIVNVNNETILRLSFEDRFVSDDPCKEEEALEAMRENIYMALRYADIDFQNICMMCGALVDMGFPHMDSVNVQVTSNAQQDVSNNSMLS